MKKLFGFLLAASLAACGNSGNNSGTTDTTGGHTDVKDDTSTRNRVMDDSLVVPDNRGREANPYNDSTRDTTGQ
ncbi:MAG TPA: hypothetical protein VGB46_06100 [Flavisolibacter sp.]|jgi:hypothetical protein